MKKTGLILVLLMGSLPNGYCETAFVSCGDLNRNIAGQGAKMLVVDVRGAGDFEQGHIPGAVNAPCDSIAKANLPREGILVLYCGNNQCPWSKLGAKALEDSGYKNVMVLDGGIANWSAEGFPLETSSGVKETRGIVPVASVSPGQVLKLLTDKRVVIIDTRSEKEFKIAHLSGAKNIPLEALPSALPELSKKLEWIICDKQGENAKTAVRQMTEKGFKAKELAGGIQVWSAKKYPLEAGGL